MSGLSVQQHLGRSPERGCSPHLSRGPTLSLPRLRAKPLMTLEVTIPPARAAEPAHSLLLTYQPARDEAGDVVGVSAMVLDIRSQTGRAGPARKRPLPKYGRTQPPRFPGPPIAKQTISKSAPAGGTSPGSHPISPAAWAGYARFTRTIWPTRRTPVLPRSATANPSTSNSRHEQRTGLDLCTLPRCTTPRCRRRDRPLVRQHRMHR